MRLPAFAITAGILFYVLMSVFSLDEGGPAQSHPQTSSGEDRERALAADHAIASRPVKRYMTPLEVKSYFHKSCDCQQWRDNDHFHSWCDPELNVAKMRVEMLAKSSTVLKDDPSTWDWPSIDYISPDRREEVAAAFEQEKRNDSYLKYQDSVEKIRQSQADAPYVYERARRGAESQLYSPPPPVPQSYTVPGRNGEIFHMYNGRITHIERPAWTQKRRD